MPTSIVFADLAGTTLAGPLAADAPALNVAAGGGAKFPPIINGQQYFSLTLTDSQTGLNREIVHVTARNGDALTILRGQEGTAARAWIAGDFAQLLWTAGNATQMVQRSQMSSQQGGLSAIIPWVDNPNGYIAGFQGITGGMPPDMVWDIYAQVYWVCVVTGTAATAAWSVLNYARLAGMTSQRFAVAPAIYSTEAVNLGQFLGRSLKTFGYQIFPGGFTLQWMQVNCPSNVSITPALPIAFGSLPLGATISYGASLPPYTGNIGIDTLDNYRVRLYNQQTSGSNLVNVIAWGY